MPNETLYRNEFYNWCGSEIEEYYMRQNLQKVKLLETYIESGQKEEFKNQLGFIFKKTKKYSTTSSGLLTIELYYRIAIVFLSYINKLDLSEKLEATLDLKSLFKMEAHQSWEEIYKYFYDMGNRIFELKDDVCTNYNNKAIDFIKNYTKENIGGDLSLGKFSELLHFNPSYLSRMYKQYSGEGISEHVSEVKFNKSKEMLKKSNMKINKIAMILGFESPSYFTKFFKKKTNLSPQEYRDSVI
jgi:two-component system, response regulator YesN